MSQPLVSVICLCYNQCRYVREAVESVINQSYKNIQLIVVDDASTDSSVDEIKKLKQEYPTIELLLLDENLGNCKAFNRALTLAKGDYLIDLAADDILTSERIEKGVLALQRAGNSYGVNFSDASWINESGHHLYNHSNRFPHASVPQGDIYKELITRYFICPPTVLFTREVIENLGGYDESLAYEDFDFWIRSARSYKFCYTPEILVKKRITPNGMAKKQLNVLSKYSASTFRVCEKILDLNKSKEEQIALTQRIAYEMKLNFRLLNFGIVLRYFFLLLKNRKLRYP